MFKVDERISIVDIARLVLPFPSFLNEEENIALMVEVLEEELKEVLHRLQKDKIPSPDGWTIEFFLGFYELINMDILDVVEKSRSQGNMHAPLNATFISLIPKYEDPKSLEVFRPISLYNYIYKVVSKIIAKRMKAILYESIPWEKIGFLEGRQIHEAIGVAQEEFQHQNQKIQRSSLKN